MVIVLINQQHHTNIWVAAPAIARKPTVKKRYNELSDIFMIIIHRVNAHTLPSEYDNLGSLERR